MSKEQKETIARLEEELKQADLDYLDVVGELNKIRLSSIQPVLLSGSKELVNKIKIVKLKREPKYAADIAIDFWPPRDWFRFRVSPYNPGRYAQINIGPLRAEFYQA